MQRTVSIITSAVPELQLVNISNHDTFSHATVTSQEVAWLDVLMNGSWCDLSEHY